MLTPGRFTVLAYSTACCACRETNANGAVVNVQAWACSFFSTGRALIVLPAFFSARRSS